MKRSLVTIAFGLTALLCLAVPSFGALILNDPTMSTTENASGAEDLCKVTFVDGNSQTVKYFEKGYELSLKDAPFAYKDGKAYTWVNGSSYLNNHFVLNGDLTLTSQDAVSSVSFSGNYDENYNAGSTEQVSTVNTDINSKSAPSSNAGLDFAFDLNVQWLKSNDVKFRFKGYYRNKLLDILGYTGSTNSEKSYDVLNPSGSIYDCYPFAYAAKGDDGITWKTSGEFVQGNSSIGLETHPADYLNGDVKRNIFYKPVNYAEYKPSSYGSAIDNNHMSEYCMARLTLQNDVVLSGNLTLGGQTGFMKTVEHTLSIQSDLHWTQLHYQGFAVGTYSEIDLNGYDLIVAGSSMLDSFGSITDSSSDHDGNIVLTNGATMYTPLVFEDMYRENSIPESFADGLDYMTMFRCPYTDCNIIFQPGCNFYGKIWISLGNNGVIQTDLYIVGSTDEAVFQLSQGTIRRETFYNQELYNKVKNSKTNATLKNIAYQKFRYIFDNANVIVNPFHMKGKISSINLDLSSLKYQKFIPPYFDFYAYGSDITFREEFIFMPGCYLYADSATTLNFTYDTYTVPNGMSSGSFNYASGTTNYSSGGLTLMATIKVNSFDKCATAGNWYDTSKDTKQYEGYGQKVWQWTDFWNYYSAIPARFDCNATLNFIDGNTMPYILAGNINFFDNFDFKQSVLSLVSSDKLRLYNSFGQPGPSTAPINCDHRQVNLAGVYSVPLISNGQFLTPLNGKFVGDSDSDYSDASYDILNGVVTVNPKIASTTPSYFGFMFSDPKGKSENSFYSHNNTSNFADMTNSFAGSWVSLDKIDAKNHRVTYGGQEYIFFTGAFLPISGDVACLNKLGGFDCNNWGGHNLFRTVSFSSNRWNSTGNGTAW